MWPCELLVLNDPTATRSGGIIAVRSEPSSWGGLPMTGSIHMPKGNLCPDCQTYTLQRISTNWMQCSTCGLKKKVS